MNSAKTEFEPISKIQPESEEKKQQPTENEDSDDKVTVKKREDPNSPQKSPEKPLVPPRPPKSKKPINQSNDSVIDDPEKTHETVTNGVSTVKK